MLEYAEAAARERWLPYGKVQRLEQLQLGEYSASNAGFYDFHSDNGFQVAAAAASGHRAPDAARLLSISVQLSDPANYNGGE